MKEAAPSENRVAIFGGDGNMGKVTVELFQNLGYEVISSDPKSPDSPKADEAVKTSSIVFFSVLPIEEISGIIEETRGLFGPSHIVLDNASVKKPLVEAYTRLEERGVSICSTHPLCKHDQPLHGQKALVLEVGSNAQRAKEVAEKLYKNAGMVTLPLSFEDHDRTMTVVQLVPHLVMRSIGQALERSGVDMSTLREIAPANFQLFNLSLWRTLVQDPNISETVIFNLLKNAEGQALAKKIKEAVQKVVATKEKGRLADMFDKDYRALNNEGIGDAMNEVTITVLERLANLQVKSITIETKEDRPGLLRDMLSPFEEHGVNLTAIDSHSRKNGIRFEIGIDEKTYSPETLAAIVTSLQAMGYSIVEIKNNQ